MISNLDIIKYYLILVNTLGFILYSIERKRNNKSKILFFLSFMGGQLGVIIAILIQDKKLDKENMMLSIFSICMLIIESIFLFIILRNKEKISFSFIQYFQNHPVLSLYLIGINILTFFLYGLDKYFAIKNKKRIKIITLLSMAFVGGSIGSYLAIHLFRHKIHKSYFQIGIPLIFTMQVVVLLFLMN